MEVFTAAALAIKAAVTAFGKSALDHGQEAVADAGQNLGRRLIDRLLAKATNAGRIRDAVSDLAEAPERQGLLDTLEFQLQKALQADPALAAEVMALLNEGKAGAARTDATITTVHGDMNGGVIGGAGSVITVSYQQPPKV